MILKSESDYYITRSNFLYIFPFFLLVLKQFLNDLIQDESKPPQKSLYELRVKLFEELEWPHLADYERKWLPVRFPSSIPPF